MAEKYQDKGLRVLAINISGRESPEQVRNYAESQNLRQTVIPGGATVAKQYGVRVAPTHIYIDPAGNVVGREKGTPEDLEQRILKMLPKS